MTTDPAEVDSGLARLARRARDRAAWIVSGGSVVFVVLGLTLYVHNRQTPGAARFFDPVLPVLALTFPATGVLVAWGRRRNPVAWVFLAGGLAAIGFFAEQYAVYALLAEPGGLPAGLWAAWVATWAWIPAYLGAFTLLPLLFPDGRPPSGRWRPLLWVVLISIAGTAVFAALAPNDPTSPAIRNVLGLKGLPALSGLGAALCVFVLGPLCLGALATRYRRSNKPARAQLRGFLAATTVAVLAPLAALALDLTGIAVPIGPYQVVGLIGVGGMAGTAVFAMVRHGLYGLEVSLPTFLNRGLVFTAMAAVAAVVYVAVAALLAALIPGRTGLAPAAVAMVVAAVAGVGIRGRVQEVADRVLYRQRNYDYAVLASLGQRLRSTLGPDAVLPVIAETMASALKLPYVNITVGRGTEVAASATYGAIREDAVVLPLVHLGEGVGRLTVAPRRPGTGFDDADRRLLDELAAQTGIVAYALCLATDLQRSRERLVTAREEERRRLRRDLHDGLKPTLSGIALGLDAVRNIVGHDPTTAGSLLVRLRSELEGAGGDIRRLVHDLRPPALDELGLVGALRQHVNRLQLSPTTPDVVLDAPPELPGLPAAVEVAAYRIGQEAMENVRTHASARSCAVTLRLDDGHLQLEVRDDGTGLDPGRRAGVGLLAMQERAAELGGSCSVENLAGAGTCVRARLPLDSP